MPRPNTQVVELSKIIRSNPTISTSIYVSGYVVGGVITLAPFLDTANGYSSLIDLLIIDKDNQKAPFTILFFNKLPTNTYTDHAACPTLGNDANNIVGQVIVLASDYITTGGSAIADIRANIVLNNNDSNSNLYMLLITTGTPTYTGNKLFIVTKFYQD